MSTHFSANQYENAFAAKRLQNWETPASFKERPSPLEGFTKPIANERGHLLPGVPRPQKSPWGDFAGTWDHGSKSEWKPPLPKLRHEGSAEILTVHSPAPLTARKDNKEQAPPSPVPQPVDEKNIGISKHIDAIKEKENTETEKQKSSAPSPLPSPLPEKC